MRVRRPQHVARRIRSWGVRLTGVFLGCTAATTANGDDWPQWLGPRQDSIWREEGILTGFPPAGPHVTWRIPVGPGYTGPAVAGGRVYLMDRQPRLDADGKQVAAEDTSLLGKERVLCLESISGKTLWMDEYDCPYRISYPAGPRTTPLVDGERLYALGAMGDLICFDAASGQRIWSRQLAQEFNTKPPVWGYAAHPLLDGEQLICLVGGEGSAVVAFDKTTGRELWRSTTAEEVGYAAPVMHERDGQRQLIVWLDVSVKGLDPATGVERWSATFPDGGNPQRPIVTIMTPRIADERLLVSNFYDGSMVLSLADNPPSVLWQAAKNDPQHNEGLNVLMAPPIIKDGHVYGISGTGELRCLNLQTGAIRWKELSVTGERKAFFATCFLVQHEDRFFLFNDQGQLIIAQLSPAGYREFGRAKLLEPTGFARGRNIVWSHPAFAEKAMFARNDKELIRVDLAAPAS